MQFWKKTLDTFTSSQEEKLMKWVTNLQIATNQKMSSCDYPRKICDKITRTLIQVEKTKTRKRKTSMLSIGTKVEHWKRVLRETERQE